MLPDSLEEDRAVLGREFWNAFDVVAGRATGNAPAAETGAPSGQALKLSPQEQLVAAFGFVTLKPPS